MWFIIHSGYKEHRHNVTSFKNCLKYKNSAFTSNSSYNTVAIMMLRENSTIGVSLPLHLPARNLTNIEYIYLIKTHNHSLQEQVYKHIRLNKPLIRSDEVGEFYHLSRKTKNFCKGSLLL